MMRLLPAAWPLRLSSLLLVLTALPALAPAPARAQLLSGTDRPQPSQSLALTYAFIDFTYDGSTPLDTTFDYVAPAYGLTYTRPNLLLSAATGWSDPSSTRPAGRELQFLEVSLFTWGELLPFLTAEAGDRRFFVPIALHSGYRRVSGEEMESGFTDIFSVTVVGLGTGLGFVGALGEQLYLEARALPTFGLATRSVGGSNGTSRLLDTDLLLYAGPFAHGLGLSAGYGFRLQDWNLGVAAFSADFGDDLFDYRNVQHTFRVGISW